MVERTYPANRLFPVVAFVAFVLVSFAIYDVTLAAGPQVSVDHPEFFEKSLHPLLAKYCVGCHSGSDPKGGIALDQLTSIEVAAKDNNKLKRVLQMLRDRSMPPTGSPQPKEDDMRAAVIWLQAATDKIEFLAPSDAGHVSLRRLNRAEYANTIRDLLGIKFDATAAFPADDVGNGFDNIGDVLTLPPLLMDKYFVAAERIAREAIEINSLKADPSRRPKESQRLFIVRPDSSTSDDNATDQIVRHFALRAYRRPATDREIERLIRLVKSVRNHGASFEDGIQLAVKAILVSPKFLFRMEVSQRGMEENRSGYVSEYQLATRLSYFLWSSMPDEALFKQASRSSLRTNLKSEVPRMLADGKIEAFVQNFAGQWLQLRKLDRTNPNHDEFPTYSDDLRHDMKTETEMFFEALLRENRSVLDFVDADFTYVDERLARHYGIAGVKGDTFQRVSLKSTNKSTEAGNTVGVRGGIITQASMLTVTSNPTRTSPVKRGKWIMENVLGTPPADPPPNVPMLEEGAQAASTASLRERMEIHRKNADCAVCHNAMDPLGFALENFDGIGKWRSHDGTFAIDPSGELPGGKRFSGPNELKNLLKGEGKEKFTRCLTEKMLTYALGRGLDSSDHPAVDRIVEKLAKNDYRFSTLIFGIIESDPFQKRGAKQ